VARAPQARVSRCMSHDWIPSTSCPVICTHETGHLHRYAEVILAAAEECREAGFLEEGLHNIRRSAELGLAEVDR